MQEHTKMHLYPYLTTLLILVCVGCEQADVPDPSTERSPHVVPDQPIESDVRHSSRPIELTYEELTGERVPTQIQALADEIQFVVFNDVRGVIVQRLGPPDRQVGSGILSDQWDAANGVLTLTGQIPKYVSDENQFFWLIETKNPILPNIIGQYEMYTQPEEVGGGGAWLGNVELHEDMSYAYVDSGTNPDKRGGQAANFFMNHPSGTFDITYANGIRPHGLLEDLSNGQHIADMTFAAQGADKNQVYSLLCDKAVRRLVFAFDAALTFRLEKFWNNWP